ncbi:MAG: hypothetical protein WCK98_07555 [bacterium]
MPFLPSLLEYSRESLNRKLNEVKSRIEDFKEIQNSLNSATKPGDSLSFHLDFVLPYFAKDRKVMTSLGLESVLNELEQEFSDYKLDLSIHLMGTSEDLFEAHKFLLDYHFKPNWLYTVFVPEKYTSTFWPQTQVFTNYKVGIWHDLNDYNIAKIEQETNIENYLLMTVVAGKSGQKLDTKKQQLCLQLCTNFSEKKFIVDGGWGIDFRTDLDNLEVVSYSSFWKAFERNKKLS